jgi:hypothetical protein
MNITDGNLIQAMRRERGRNSTKAQNCLFCVTRFQCSVGQQSFSIVRCHTFLVSTIVPEITPHL